MLSVQIVSPAFFIQSCRSRYTVTLRSMPSGERMRGFVEPMKTWVKRILPLSL